MKKVVHKTFLIWNFDEEEKWLNEMSAKGLQLIDVGFFRYTFEEGQPGEYIYRLELLEGYASAGKNRDYVQFLEGTGVEHVVQFGRWAYFRKKADGKGFDLFSDIESRIRHLNRISAVAAILSLVNLFNGINRIHHLFSDGARGEIVITILCLSVGALLGYGFLYLFSKKRKLQREKQLHE